jgi:hypothetical protein
MSDFDVGAYLDAAAAALDLPLPPDVRTGVTGHWLRLRDFAQMLLDETAPTSGDESGHANGAGSIS